METVLCTLAEELIVEPGTRAEYESLAHYHYRDAALGPVATIFTIRHHSIAAAIYGRRPIGVLVETMPAANLALRQRPSDRPGAPGSSPGSGAGVPTSPDGAFNPQAGQYYQPVQPTQYYPGGQPGQPGQFPQPGQFGQQGQPGQPAQMYPAGQQMQPGQPGQTNQGQPSPFYPPGMVQPQTGQPGQVTGGMITGSGYPGGGQQVAQQVGLTNLETLRRMAAS